jgi:FixJ family two-component response regulator
MKPQDVLSEPSPVVVVIDDDPAICEALEGLLESVGLQSRTFGSVRDYLAKPVPVPLGCMVLDVRLPGRSGLEYLDDLNKEACPLPVVFISGHADVPMSVRAMKAGAVEFLTKPVRPQDLLEAIQAAISKDRRRRFAAQQQEELACCYASLTAREREVVEQIVKGRLNKQIAGDLGLTEGTVKIHRSNAMRKMKAGSLVDLVRSVDQLRPGPGLT